MKRVGNSISLQTGPGALVPGGGERWVRWLVGFGENPRVLGTLGRGDVGCKEMLLPTLLILIYIYIYMYLNVYIYIYIYIYTYI